MGCAQQLILMILVATFASSIRAQLEINPASLSDGTNIGEQHTALKENAEPAHPSHGFVKAYLDPVDWTKYYKRYTNIFGKVTFVKRSCPIANVFNPSNEKCTNKWKGINNPPKLTYLEGDECKGIQGYFCKNDKYTYCTEDNLKIVLNKSCPGGMLCCRGKTNPCICNDDR